MKHETVKISDLKEYPNNAKIHTQEQIDQIIKSISDYGNNDPIGIDENNMILEGHGRYLALKQLGVEEVPVIRITHLNEKEKREYILVHNKTNQNTGFDLDILELELEDLDLSFYDFDVKAVDEITNTSEEYDIEKFEDKMTLKFTFNQETYEKVINKLRNINPILDEALLEVLDV